MLKYGFAKSSDNLYALCIFLDSFPFDLIFLYISLFLCCFIYVVRW